LAVIAALGVAVGSAPAPGQSQTKLTAADGAAEDEFGVSVGLDGDRALIGAYGDADNGILSGSAYIFEKQGGVWVQTAKLTAGDGAASNYFGCSVGLDGDRALIGAYGDDDNGFLSGSAYVFEKQGAVWVQTGKLTASDGAEWGFFGYSVGLDADRALIGAFGDDDDSGSAYVFEKQGGVWVQTAKLTADDGAAYDYFGVSVGLDGDRALIGALLDDDNGYYSGSAYVFEKQGDLWVQTAKLTAADGAAYDSFGYSVGLDADRALVGAYGDDDSGDDSGSAYVFDLCAGDVDGDGDTDHADLGALLSAWDSYEGDPNWNPNADLDGNGHVGHSDLGILLGDWGCGT